ncbi:MAG: amidohydrolase [Phycisphaeraceae bacterium]|nr:MAG: amidohydrolase [Phycisphaeraceae bacterium]
MTLTLTAQDLPVLTQDELREIIELRRDLHAHPELNYEEVRTSGVVSRELERLGIACKAGVAKTGVVGYLPATTAEGNQRPSTALRADMDALPIVEQTGKPYASTSPGRMHACGHDGHTAMLLGAARVLARLTHRPRPVTFIFQPAEEGGAGGELMCREGALKGEGHGGVGNPVGEIFGLHGWPTYPVGHVATRPGALLASVDDVELTVRGTQCHGAYPHQGHDPILATAQVITALQAVASRSTSPLDSVVVTCGEVRAGTANNIIPESCWTHWTVRTLKDSTRAMVKQRFIETATGVASALGCRAQVEYRESYPVTHNDARLVHEFFGVARSALGDARVGEVEQPTMGGEDFSYYGRHVPACFFFLGLRPATLPAGGRCPALHQPDFDFNDDAIPTGVGMFVRLATR